MQDLFVDVTTEVPLARLAIERDPTQYVIGLLRDAGDKLCESSGARLRTDRVPELIVKQAVSPAGVDVLLCAVRWAVVAPAGVPVI